ncbi:NlpC/P60 family protein [Jannaschia rubra]|uniref:NlpC/P60 family protein n=1 Tax=Jannaschia rubra TaxID=282197 RepID=UPI00248F705C|nr:NlpC/P60 family protein [Jannaschia rubra]
MSRVVGIARGWLGTPYVHQASVKGAGTDCLGLVRGVWRELYGREPEAVPSYSQDWAEPQGIEVLQGAALRHLRPILGGAVRAGDLLLFRMRDGSIAKHLGIAAEVGAMPTFIHAYSGHGVVESSLSPPWARRIAARFEFPAVAAEED